MGGLPFATLPEGTILVLRHSLRVEISLAVAAPTFPRLGSTWLNSKCYDSGLLQKWTIQMYFPIFPCFLNGQNDPKRSKKDDKPSQNVTSTIGVFWAIHICRCKQHRLAVARRAVCALVRGSASWNALWRSIVTRYGSKNGIMDLCRKFMFEMFVWFCLSASRNVDLFWDIPIWGGTHLTGIYIQ